MSAGAVHIWIPDLTPLIRDISLCAVSDHMGNLITIDQMIRNENGSQIQPHVTHETQKQKFSDPHSNVRKLRL